MNFWKIVPSMSKFESSRRFKRILENFWEKLSKFSEEFFFYNQSSLTLQLRAILHRMTYLDFPSLLLCKFLYFEILWLDIRYKEIETNGNKVRDEGTWSNPLLWVKIFFFFFSMCFPESYILPNWSFSAIYTPSTLRSIMHEYHVIALSERKERKAAI